MLLNLLLQVVPPDPAPMPAFDWTGFGVSIIQALVPVVTLLAIWLGRKIVTIVPKGWIPIVAVVLGTVFDYLTAYVSGGVFNPIVGALLGAASTWLWELLKPIGEAVTPS